jgi:hypothetical protein
MLRLPPLEDTALTRALVLVFALVLLAHLPLLLARAGAADTRWRHLIPASRGDDGAYQILAINMLHGEGYSILAVLPAETYRVDVQLADERAVTDRSLQFRRSPGLSLMLASVYAVAGTETIVAQRMMATLAWLTGVALLIAGAAIAGWVGALAGGLTAVYHVHLSPVTYGFDRLLSENPTAFWITAFAAAFAVFLNRRSRRTAIIAGLCLAAIALMRVNFLPAIPLLIGYLPVARVPRRLSVWFTAAALAPVLAWCVYASVSTGRIVIISQAGARLFANTNNLDTLEGIGPDRWNQGGWNPGFVAAPGGEWRMDLHNVPAPGESGWNKGLEFWKQNLVRLPQLFFVKWRAGLWYSNGMKENILRPERFTLAGIGFLAIGAGFLPLRKRWPWVPRVAPNRLLGMQLGVVTVLLAAGNQHGMLLVIALWLTLFVLSLLRLGESTPVPFQNPVWLLAFVASHALTTTLFYGMRFHLPIDSVLILVAVYGILFAAYELARRSTVQALAFLTIVLLAAIARPLANR